MAAPGAPGPDFGRAHPILIVSCACAAPATNALASAAANTVVLHFIARPPDREPSALLLQRDVLIHTAGRTPQCQSDTKLSQLSDRPNFVATVSRKYPATRRCLDRPRPARVSAPRAGTGSGAQRRRRAALPPSTPSAGLRASRDRGAAPRPGALRRPVRPGGRDRRRGLRADPRRPRPGRLQAPPRGRAD